VNLGTGADVAAGVKAGASLVKGSTLPPLAKLGVVTVGAIIGGGTVTIINTINTIENSKVTTSKIISKVSTSNQPPSNNTLNSPSDAFSMEPSADMDTILSLLNANYIMHICITYLILIILVLYIADKVVTNK